MTPVEKFRIYILFHVPLFGQVAFEFGKYVFYFVEDEVSMPIDNSVDIDADVRVTL